MSHIEAVHDYIIVEAYQHDMSQPICTEFRTLIVNNSEEVDILDKYTKHVPWFAGSSGHLSMPVGLHVNRKYVCMSPSVVITGCNRAYRVNPRAKDDYTYSNMKFTPKVLNQWNKYIPTQVVAQINHHIVTHQTFTFQDLIDTMTMKWFENTRELVKQQHMNSFMEKYKSVVKYLIWPVIGNIHHESDITG